MRRSNWTPSVVPNGDDQNVYLVVDDFGRNGRAYRQTDVEVADLEATIMGPLEGQFSNTIRVVAFNTAGKGSQDLSDNVVHEIRRRCDLQANDVPLAIQDFVERHKGIARQLTLRLV